MIISICGDPGSGKTSVTKILSERLGMPWYSMGDLRGKIARDRGITIDELNRIGETDKSTDTAVDDLQKRMGEEEDGFVIEGRLSWHFIPKSFKVFLHCEPAEAARRIFLQQRNREGGREDERRYASEADVMEEMRKRVESDARRYEKHYGVRLGDMSNFDLVLDTTGHASPEETAEQILKAVGKG